MMADDHICCWHNYFGPIYHIPIPDGHIVEKCCKCSVYRTVHIDSSISSTWTTHKSNTGFLYKN